MRQYEITFIIDPVLPGDEVKAAAKAYEKLLTEDGCTIVHMDDMGLKELAYPIKKRNSGMYQCIEFQTGEGNPLPKMELAMRRDERVLRFLTVKLDKNGIKYNDDKRKGLIGKKTSEKSDSDKPKEERAPRYKDDLTLIYGIEAKTAKLLNTAGITSYAKLSSATPAEVAEILTKGGPAFKGIETATWPDQGQLAASAKWTQLTEMKDKLSGNTSSEEE